MIQQDRRPAMKGRDVLAGIAVRALCCAFSGVIAFNGMRTLLHRTG
jgi:hypothetical protein